MVLVMTFKKANFNLIEILISMIVIIFAMFILVSLFPLSMKESSEASQLNNIAGLTESVSSFIKRLPLDSSSDFALADLPTSKPTTETNRALYPKLSSSTFDSAEDIAFQTKLLEHNSSSAGLFLLSSYDEVVNGSTTTKTKIAEIEVRIWHSAVSANSDFTGNSSWVSNPANFMDSSLKSSSALTSLHYPTVTYVNVEFSWPLNKAYAERQKKFFFLTLNRLQD